MIDVKGNLYASAVICPACWRAEDIKGSQLQGVVNQVKTRTDIEVVWKNNIRKFSFVKSMQLMIEEHQLNEFQSYRIQLVDNSIAFGYKKEWRRDPNLLNPMTPAAVSWKGDPDQESLIGAV